MRSFRKPHIALISEHASPLAQLGSADSGGQNVYVREVSRRVGALGWPVDVFTRLTDQKTPMVQSLGPGARVISIQAGPPREVAKDDLWPHMPEFRSRILEFARTEGRRYDLVHGNFWMSGWVAVEIAGEFGIPSVQIFHAMGKTKRRHQGDDDTSPANRIDIETDVIRRTTRLIAQCPSEARELIEDYSAPRERVAIIPSGVDTDLFQPVSLQKARAALGFSPDVFLVGYVGRILPRKDIRNVVKAVALASKSGRAMDLMVAGGESEAPDPQLTPEIGVLQALSHQLGTAHQVHFVGKQQPNDLKTYYSACDVVVTTPWYEPFGLTPLEAMACGRAVVGSRVGGIEYTVAHGVTGILVPPRNPDCLAEALIGLRDNPERLREMGAAGRTRVEHRFTWRVTAEQTRDLYEATLSLGADEILFPPGRTELRDASTQQRTHSRLEVSAH